MDGIGPRMTLASAVIALVAAAIFGALLASIESERNAANNLRHERKVIADATAIRFGVLGVETGLRGFLVARSDAFLQPFDQARRLLPDDMAALLEDVARDSSAERRAAAAIVGLTHAYLSGYAMPLVSEVRANRRMAVSMQTLVHGKGLVDDLRRRIDPFVATQDAAVLRARASADRAVRRAVAIAIVGLVTLVLMMIGLRTYLVRAIERPVRRVAGAVDVI
ncbi:MAG: multi-sensor signal transduction histidine kinase, partial [Solirubrobacterales bacterium]|nr:multi-sensor signal transduction histidine kinase [Solirubrobacterales bacterium]